MKNDYVLRTSFFWFTLYIDVCVRTESYVRKFTQVLSPVLSRVSQ